MTLRMGILGTARIAPTALITPAARIEGIEVVAAASRDAAKAQKFADKHSIARSHDSYEGLLADADVDAVYIPLPNALHCEWSIKAMESGKHVLCEKPLACNEAEAQQMADAAERTGRVLLEGFHYRYHPFAAAVGDVLSSGVLGKLERIETAFNFPIISRKDIRYDYDLGGGAMMDVGCYAVNFLRFLAGAEPQVTAATAKLASPKIDRTMNADVKFDDGCTGSVSCSMLSVRFINLRCKVIGAEGKMIMVNPYGPHVFNLLRVDAKSGKKFGMQERGESTYFHQLRAFQDAVTNGTQILTPAVDAVKNMQVIDTIYKKAGLPPRGASQ